MIRNRALKGLLAVALILSGSAVLRAETRSGDWTIRDSKKAGQVRFSIFSRSKDHGSWQSQFDLEASELSGLDLSVRGRREVQFALVRDAGRLDCEGYLDDGEGAGLFTFTPDLGFGREMSSLNFSVDGDKQFSMAVHDVSVGFARQMRGADLTDLDSGKLLAFRIHGVSLDFIEGLRSAGQPVRSSSKLIAFKIHGVSAEMVRSLRQAGYEPSDSKLVALKIHGASPDWVEELAQRGYENIDLDKLVAFRIHGVTPDFIGALQRLGYDHPEPQQLISMKIHGVSPGYIENLESRGLKDLTISKLIQMKIHGLD